MVSGKKIKEPVILKTMHNTLSLIAYTLKKSLSPIVTGVKLVATVI
jgi:hypothetical protein